MKYFCADLHADRGGHSVLRRPFSNAYEMTSYLVDGINRRVGRNDELIIAGDFAFSWKETAFWRQKIRCRRCFITRGNHDIKLRQLKKIFGDSYAENLLETRIKNLDIVVCHYPMLYWNRSHYNWGMLHGHLHDQRTDTYMALLPEIRLLDVAFESAKRHLGDFIPFNEDEIYDILMSRKGHDDIEFYKSLSGDYLKSHVKKI